MRRLRIQYSPIGERWSIDVLGVDDASLDAVELGDVTIWRDERGRMTSLVIDSPRLEPDVLEIVSAEFGKEVVDLMVEQRGHDLDEVVTIDATSNRLVVSEDSPRSHSTVIVFPGEPGVPVSRKDGSFVVTVEIQSKTVEASIEHDRIEARLYLQIHVPLVGEPLWVRVAEGETGAILALAPLREYDGDAVSVDLPFGLAMPLTSLHFSVSEDPLDDPGERTDRRMRWAERLETKARVRARRFRSDAAALFERAADVHSSLGDSQAAERCLANARRTRRRRRLVGGVFLTVLAGAFLMIGSFLGRVGDESIPPGDETPVTMALGVAPPPATTVIPPEAGPVDLVFDERREAQVFAVGPVTLRPGGRLELVVRARIESTVTFNRLVDCEAAESGISVFGGDGPMYQPIFVPTLQHLSSTSLGSRAFPSFAIDRSIETYFVLPGACQETWLRDDEPFDVRALASYTPFTTALLLPEDIETGSWSLNLVWESEPGTSMSGSYVTVRVIE